MSCVEYATNHPDATGQEIIDAQKIKVLYLKSSYTSIDMNILDRPLNP